jgi:hypothetical protein
MINPVSVEELSCQFKSISLEETVDAERLEGATGNAFFPA